MKCECKPSCMLMSPKGRDHSLKVSLDLTFEDILPYGGNFEARFLVEEATIRAEIYYILSNDIFPTIVESMGGPSSQPQKNSVKRKQLYNSMEVDIPNQPGTSLYIRSQICVAMQFTNDAPITVPDVLHVHGEDMASDITEELMASLKIQVLRATDQSIENN